MKFVMEINLGNGCMDTQTDVAGALDKTAQLLRRGARLNEQYSVKDLNGNDVGHWSLSDADSATLSFQEQMENLIADTVRRNLDITVDVSDPSEYTKKVEVALYWDDKKISSNSDKG